MQFWSIVQRTASYSDTEKLLPVSFGLVTFKNSNVYVWPLYQGFDASQAAQPESFCLKVLWFLSHFGGQNDVKLYNKATITELN